LKIIFFSVALPQKMLFYTKTLHASVNAGYSNYYLPKVLHIHTSTQKHYTWQN